MQPAQTQTLQADSVDMPSSGAVTEPTSPTKREAPRPRIPIGHDALEQIKKRPSAPRAGVVTPAATKKMSQAAPAVNCVTNSSTNSTPSGIHGAAGPTNIITVTNTDVGVYDKSNCNLIRKMSLDKLFKANVYAGEGYFDPQVLWDDVNQRFIVTAESTFGFNTNQNQGFAVSKDSSGTSWWVYVLQIINGSTVFCVPDSTFFWDYPHVGSLNGTNPRWFIVANVFPAVGNDTSAIISITKTPSLSGQNVTVLCFPGLNDNNAPPNVKDAGDTAYFLSTSSIP
jgi:hypothetical protein